MSQHTNSNQGSGGFSDTSAGTSTSGFGQEDGGGLGSQARQQGSAGVGQIKGGASTLAKKARKQISQYADAQKSTVTGQIDTLVSAIRQAGEELGQNNQAQASQLVTQVADGLESLSRTIDDADISDVVNSVRRFGRSNPAIFVGGAVLAGIALARFARASSESRSGQAAQNWQGGGSSGSGSWAGQDAQFGSQGTSGTSPYGARGAAGSFRTGGAATYGGPGATGAGALGTAASAATGAGGFGGAGGGGGSQGSFAPSTGRAGDAPQASQGYAGGGMGRDPIQSSAGSGQTSSPSSAREPSVGGSSTSGGGIGSGSISTGENS